jgi:ABC-type transporter Mla subunit MlaD
MNQASIVLKQVPNLIKRISADLSTSANAAKQSIEKAKLGNKIAHENSNVIGKVRKQMRDAAGGIQSLNERSQEISKVARTVEDLAHRTNMIALNASIQATELGEKGGGFVLVAAEIEKLANRADRTNRQISTVNKSILAEINKVEHSLDATNAEVSNLSRFAIETANVLSELERYVGQFLNLQENLISYSQQQSEETDDAFQTFVKSIGETENAVADLKDSALNIKNLSNTMRNLQLMISEYRLIQNEEEFINLENEKEQSSIQAATESNSVEDERISPKDEKFIFEGFDLNDSFFAENDDEQQDFDEPDSKELLTQNIPETETVSAELDLPKAKAKAKDFDVDDLQIEETKISYDTAELSFDFDKNPSIPTYEEI